MYRLTLYGLIILVTLAVVFSFLHLLAFSPIDILLSTWIACVVGYIVNKFTARLVHASTNTESVFITALILVLIVPPNMPQNALFIALASALAMISKYLVTVDKSHVFNPAAIAVAFIVLIMLQFAATWWVGTTLMAPFVLIFAFLIARKTRREEMLTFFFVAYTLLITMAAWLRTGQTSAVINIWQLTFLHSAVFFFAGIMLTEPLTSPTTKNLSNWYAAIVALLYATPQLRLADFAFTPELALLVGNLFTFVTHPKMRLVLSLQSKQQLTHDTYQFNFDGADVVPNFDFTPGQYMEWTLPHANVDSRGNRRYFSLASSPTEKNPMLLIKFYEPSSSYKKALINLKPGQQIIAAQVAGDFVLPKNFSNAPITWIAGGVGVAPFRSMIQYIIDKKIKVDITLFFVNRHLEDIFWVELLERAAEYGVRTVYVLTDKKTIPANWQGKTGHVSAEMIMQELPYYNKRRYYISGPQLMVQSTDLLLQGMNIPREQIITDFFPGYAEA